MSGLKEENAMRDDELFQKLATAFGIMEVKIAAIHINLSQSGMRADAINKAVRLAKELGFETFKRQWLAHFQKSVEQAEKDWWDQLGIGDLWMPSGRQEPDEPV